MKTKRNKQSNMFFNSIVSILLFFSCQLFDNSSKAFIKQYGKDDFAKFQNTGFAIRGFDSGGNTIVFASGNLKNAANNGPLIVAVDVTNYQIRSIDRKLLIDST